MAPLSAQSIMSTSVEILDDNEVEPCEEFIIELSTLSGRAVVEGDGKAVVQINDNEGIVLFCTLCFVEVKLFFFAFL